MMRFLLCVFAVALPAAAEEEKQKALDDPSRPNLNFFGAKIFADEINPLTGEAKGRVYIDGSELNKTEPKFPVSVRAESVTVDLANGNIVVAGWPRLEWPGMVLIAKAAGTTIRIPQWRGNLRRRNLQLDQRRRRRRLHPPWVPILLLIGRESIKPKLVSTYLKAEPERLRLFVSWCSRFRRAGHVLP